MTLNGDSLSARLQQEATISRGIDELSPVHWRREEGVVKLPRELTPNPRAILGFMSFERHSEPCSVFEGVNRIPAGCGLTIGSDGYYRLQRRAIESSADASSSELIWANLVSSCSELAGTRVALASGGGLDSSVLAAALREAGVDFAIATMVAPGFPQTDEMQQGKALAEYFGVIHKSFDITQHLPFLDVSLFREHPELGPAIHPGISYEGAFFRDLYDSGFRVVVGGWGADELFSMTRHEWYVSNALRGTWSTSVSHAGFREFKSVLRTATSRAIHAASLRSVQRLSIFDPRRWVPNDLFRDSGITLGIELVRTYDWDLANQYLVRLERLSGVQFFQPFKSIAMLRLRAALPHSIVSDVRGDKHFLREIAFRKLPPSISRRPKLQTFDSVIHRGWMRSAHSDILPTSRMKICRLGWVREGAFARSLEHAKDSGKIPPTLFRSLSVEWWLEGLAMTNSLRVGQ